ncbi:MAG: ISKra4 family transposase, partial [bacterium]
MMQAPAPLPPAPFAQAEAQFAALVSHLHSEEAQAMTHSELERELEEKGRELLRSLLQGHLELRSPGEASAPVR